MGYWFDGRHEVMQAVLTNALNSKHPKQREWAEWYLELTMPERRPTHPAARAPLPPAEKHPEEPNERSEDDDMVVFEK